MSGVFEFEKELEACAAAVDLPTTRRVDLSDVMSARYLSLGRVSPLNSASVRLGVLVDEAMHQIEKNDMVAPGRKLYVSLVLASIPE